MKITVISAPKRAVKGLKTEKGQSLFIQAEGCNFLFGFGADNAFLKNMTKLGISPEAVDVAVLPCGNKVEGGGLPLFLEQNAQAQIYARINAFEWRYQKSLFSLKDVSLDESLRLNRRILRCKTYFVSKDNRFATFSLNGQELDATQKPQYFVKDGQGELKADDFSHETYLLIRIDKRWALFLGNAYVGEENVVKQARQLITTGLGGTLEWIIANNLSAGEVIELN